MSHFVPISLYGRKAIIDLEEVCGWELGPKDKEGHVLLKNGMMRGMMESELREFENQMWMFIFDGQHGRKLPTRELISRSK